MSIKLRLWQPERSTVYTALYTAVVSLPIIFVGAVDLTRDPVEGGSVATLLLWVLLISAALAISFGLVVGVIAIHFRERISGEGLAYFASICGFIAVGLAVVLAILVRGPFARWAGLAIGVIMLLRSIGVPLAFRMWQSRTGRRAT